MRLAPLSIVVVIVAQGAMAGSAMPTVEELRSALGRARLAKIQAGADKTNAYREAHILYKNCAKELRVFCLLSAQKIMRDADFAYKDRESREFANIAVLERSITEREGKTKTDDAPR